MYNSQGRLLNMTCLGGFEFVGKGLSSFDMALRLGYTPCLGYLKVLLLSSA